MSLEFGRPEAFFLLAVVPLLVLLQLRSRVYLPGLRRGVVLGVRALAVAVLVAALAEPYLLLAADRVSAVFLLDGSDSISPEGRQQAETWLRQSLSAMGPNDRGAVVFFGKEPRVERELSGDRSLPNVQTTVDGSRTNLAGALRLGLALLPSGEGRRVVVLGDGNENLGQAEAAAKLAGAGGAEVSFVPVGGWNGPEVLLRGVEVPGTLREQESFVVRAEVVSNLEVGAKVSVETDGGDAMQETVGLKRGANRLTFQHAALGPGFHSIKVRVEPEQDTLEQNNWAAAYAFVVGAPRVLVVEGNSGDGRYLAKAIEAGGAKVDLRPAAGTPGRVPDLLSFDSVVLVDVPAGALNAGQMQALSGYVHDFGGGLAVIGGGQSYGVGGYARTPLEEMLPVQIGTRGKKVSPSTALILVVDKSGSMSEGPAGYSKMDLVKQAAMKSAKVLNEQDQLGIITFDEEPTWAYQPQYLTNPSAAQKAIGTIQSGGGTLIYPALQMAFDALVPLDAKVKHIVLLTDALGEKANWDTLLWQMRSENITLTTIGVGSDADTVLLQGLAQKGQGRYYDGNDPFAVPQLLVRETQEVAKAAIVEQSFRPVVGGQSPILSGLPMETMPALQGYVATTTKPNAQALLLSPLDDPVLAEWQYGLGRVIAWTSDARDRWSSKWLTWEGFGRFWNQVVKRTFPAQIDANLQARAEVVGDNIQITADAVGSDRGYRNFAQTKAVVAQPSGEKQEVGLEQVGPGRYRGKLAFAGEGTYLVEVLQEGPDGVVVASRTQGLVVPYSPEYGALGVNQEALDALAMAGAGRALTSPAQAFQHNLRVAGDRQSMWIWLVVAAVALALLDVAARRVRVPVHKAAAAWRRVWRTRAAEVAGAAMRERLAVAKRRTAPAASELSAQASRVILATPAARPTPLPIRSRPPAASAHAAPGSAASSRTATRLLGAKRRAHERVHAASGESEARAA